MFKQSITHISSEQSQQDSSKLYISERESNSLSLRKKKINDLLMKKRHINLPRKETPSEFVINIDDLNLSPDVTTQSFQSPTHFLTQMLNYLNTNSLPYIQFAIQKIRTYTIEKDCDYNLIPNSGVIEALLSLIQQHIEHTKIAYEIIWIFINVTTRLDNNELIYKLTDDKLLNVYYTLMQKQHEEWFHITIWLLRNVTCNNKESLTKVVKSKIFNEHIVKYLKRETKEYNIEVLIDVISICANIPLLFNYNIINDIDNNNTNEYIELEELLTRELCEKCLINNKEIAKTCLYGLVELSNSKNLTVCNLIFSSGIIRHLVKNKIAGAFEMGHQCLILIGNFLANQSQDIIDPIFYRELVIYLGGFVINSPNSEIKKTAYWALSNILVDNKEKNDFVFNSELMGVMLRDAQLAEPKVQYEVLYALNCMLGERDPETVIKLETYHLMDIMLKILRDETVSTFGMTLVWNIIDTILSVGEMVRDYDKDKQNVFLRKFQQSGGVDLMNKYFNHQDVELSQYVQKIAEKLFQINA